MSTKKRRATMPPDGSERLRAFCAAYRALSAKERETAARWIAGQIHDRQKRRHCDILSDVASGSDARRD